MSGYKIQWKLVLLHAMECSCMAVSEVLMSNSHILERLLSVIKQLGVLLIQIQVLRTFATVPKQLKTVISFPT